MLINNVAGYLINDNIKNITIDMPELSWRVWFIADKSSKTWQAKDVMAPVRIVSSKI